MHHKPTTSITTSVLLLLFLGLEAVWCGSNSGVFLNKDAFLSENIEDTRKQLAQLMTVSCTKKGIVVSFQRDQVIGLGVILPTQLTLADPQCQSTGNHSHIELRTGFQECNTKIEFSSEQTRAEVRNSVHISPPAILLTGDDEDTEMASVNISFKCTYSHRSAPDPSKTTESSAIVTAGRPGLSLPTIKYAVMRLYNTDSYTLEVNLRDNIMRGTSLYAQIEAFNGAGGEQYYYVDSCYLSRKSHSVTDAETHYLIKNGCAVDRDVQFKQDSKRSPRRFLFRARRLYRNRRMYLHCSLVACHTTGVSQCTTQEQYCSQRGQSQPASPFHTKLSGSMMVVKRRPFNAHLPTPARPSIPQRSVKSSESLLKVDKVSPNQPKSCPPVQTIPAPCLCPPAKAQKLASGVAETKKPTSGTVSIGITAILSVISFFIGAGLMALIWLIYHKTDPRRKMHSVPMSDDGLSSQESTVPNVKLMKRGNESPSSDESR